ncbi:MAG TPA: GNAT family N-acetyltransferase [Ilumatobacteraceae bacterium]|nr:GNAT family N-acetyltransferase [Ilumatobacteraceae bacterium]HRB04468.1 GNAT family N-acetyltransferase [Ilumatobacteraceae bacterium]
MTIEIRDARLEDADACAAAHIEGWRSGYRGLLPDEFLDAPEFAQQRIDRWRSWTWADGLIDGQVFVGELRGRVVGFAICAREREQPACDSINVQTPSASASNRGEVLAFYLHPDAWGSGVAPALMARCHEYLCDLGYTEAVLWVLRDNPRARRFYENAGWSATGREMMFDGPQTAAKLAEPLPEIEYSAKFV